MGDYADRRPHADEFGNPLAQNENDARSEEEVARILEDAWPDTKVHRFGRLAQIDFYIWHRGYLKALAELKTRTHEKAKYDTVFLNVRKYVALMLGSIGMSVPSLFVVRFTDWIGYVSIFRVDGNSVRMGGCKARVKSHTDREPVILVPVHSLLDIHTHRPPEKD